VTGPLQLTNGRQVVSDFSVFNCADPDIFESSAIGNCHEFEFGPRSMITGNITVSGIDGYRGDWIKIKSSSGLIVQCFIDGKIDLDNSNHPTYRDFSCNDFSLN
jgi:hypothetical protein